MRALPILLLLAGSAYADGVAVKPQATHSEGEYGGVEPGHGAAKKMKPPPKGTLAWVGFEAKTGGTQLFFQSVAPFETTQHLEGNTLVIELGGLTKLGQNTWRELDTRFFDTPILKIVAGYGGKKKKGNVEVRVTFKNPKDAAQAQMRTATEADGYFYSYLTFGGGGGGSGEK